MNKPRKIRPEKIAADAYLRQLQSDGYDNFKPNILARKLMGVSSRKFFVGLFTFEITSLKHL